MSQSLGLALSGGGSRAIAFHRGTLRALFDLGIDTAVDVVSTVSGGSVFGAAWVCSTSKKRKAPKSVPEFLDELQGVLRRGFVLPALLSLQGLRWVVDPWYSRTELLADVFSDLCGGGGLADLPPRPLLCLNSTVLNHGLPARFAPGGFSCHDVGDPLPDGSYPEFGLPKHKIGFAVAASAAFPFGLPPLTLESRALGDRFRGALRDHRRLYLTDGGVLENLGVERLLSSTRFGTRDLVVSDAGVAEQRWEPTLIGRIKSALAFGTSAQTLERLLDIMNGKQNKNMRQLLMARIGAGDALTKPRRLWFVRINQSWSSFLQGISQSVRLKIAAGGEVPPENAPADEVFAFLSKHKIDLAKARRLYSDAAHEISNRTGTNFTGFDQKTIDALASHAEWQVHACRAIYGEVTERAVAAGAA